MIAIDHRPCTDLQTARSFLGTRDDVLHLLLQIPQLIAHRTRGVEDEEDIDVLLRLAGFVEDEGVQPLRPVFGYLLPVIDGNIEIRMLAAEVLADKLVPELRLAGVVRHRLEERVAGIIQETHSLGGNGVPFFVHHLRCITMPRAELPLSDILLVRVVDHFRPEIPFREVVHFAGGQQTGRDVSRLVEDGAFFADRRYVAQRNGLHHRGVRCRRGGFGVKDIPPARTGDVHRSGAADHDRPVVLRLLLRVRQQPNDQHRLVSKNRMRRLITLAGDEKSRGSHLLGLEHHAAVERGGIDILLHLHFGVRQQRLGRIHDDNRQRLVTP